MNSRFKYEQFHTSRRRIEPWRCGKYTGLFLAYPLTKQSDKNTNNFLTKTTVKICNSFPQALQNTRMSILPNLVSLLYSKIN